jgi:phosphate transport system substrate-binding protein
LFLEIYVPPRRVGNAPHDHCDRIEIREIEGDMFNFFIVFAATLVMIVNHAQAESLKLSGSTTLNLLIIQPYQSEIEKASKTKLLVIPSKSSGGIVSLFEGRADIAMLSASLAGEIELLRNSYPGLPFQQLHHFPIARTRMAFAVHPEIMVRSLTPDLMRRVLSGNIDNWRDLGDSDLPIRLVMVRDGGGVKLSVEKALLGGKPVSVHDPIYVQIGSQVVRVVRQLPGALGLAQLKHLQKENLPEIVLTGDQVFQELSFVTLGEPTVASKAVIDATRDVAQRVMNED